MSSPRRRIIVLAGGSSAERDISLQSGLCVSDALRSRGHIIQMLDPALDILEDMDPRSYDVAFPMLHGTGGEDGTLQRQLSRLQIPFVGSDAIASALTFDKIRCQATLRQAGLPVARSIAIGRGQSLTQMLPAIGPLGYPLVVKPSQQGSSVGVTVVERLSLLATAVQVADAWEGGVLIEQFVPGREFTVPVVDGEAFPPVEIIPARRWFDYLAKYVDDATEYRVAPVDAPDNLSALALAACEVTGVCGICRVDFRVRDDNTCSILEINTIPGMTSHSLVPMSAAHRGLSVGQLCEGVIEFCLSRQRQVNPDVNAA